MKKKKFVKNHLIFILLSIIFLIVGVLVILKSQFGTRLLSQITQNANNYFEVDNKVEEYNPNWDKRPTLPQPVSKWEVNTSPNYYSEFLAKYSCSDFNCLADQSAYDLNMADIKAYYIQDTWEDTFKRIMWYCGASGLGGEVWCEYVNYKDFTSSRGAKGFVITQTRNYTGIRTEVVEDRSYVFPVNDKNFPAVILYTGLPNPDNLAFLDKVADSFLAGE